MNSTAFISRCWLCSNLRQFWSGPSKSNTPCYNFTFSNYSKCKQNIWVDNGGSQIWKPCLLYTPKSDTDWMTIGLTEMVRKRFKNVKRFKTWNVKLCTFFHYLDVESRPWDFQAEECSLRCAVDQFNHRRYQRELPNGQQQMQQSVEKSASDPYGQEVFYLILK